LANSTASGCRLYDNWLRSSLLCLQAENSKGKEEENQAHWPFLFFFLSRKIRAVGVRQIRKRFLQLNKRQLECTAAFVSIATA
jgi:hypothetical protein